MTRTTEDRHPGDVTWRLLDDGDPDENNEDTAPLAHRPATSEAPVPADANARAARR
ncbi:hypothetical protein [Actinocatenispora rupis]|uniref:hypothetical protein n=1 Tax=Actinocatenispora rupis TaxID=519421 RepID=UPI001942B1AE|nr:hypothetical protein [Actinocatenispora rupis]